MTLHEKLFKLKQSVKYLQKKKNGEVKYSYVSSTDVVAPIREMMDKEKLLLIPEILSHNVEQIDKTEKATTLFTEIDLKFTWYDIETGEKLEINWYGQGVDRSSEKGIGKALTYAEKYFLLKFFNIPTDNDDPDTFARKKEGKRNKTNETNNDNTLISMKEKEELKKVIGPAAFAAEMNKCGGKMTKTRYEELLATDGWSE